MPVSKKRRRKRTTARSPKGASSAIALPDRRAMEGIMSAITGREAEDPVASAQNLMYEAWDHPSRRTRIDLAHKALAISPLCADAYVLLAEESAASSEQALEYFRKGVEAGEQALGPEGFKEYEGHFWGFLETRPYMRARAGLAATLNALGKVDAAISHYKEMLRLNPNDNQGVRYVLAGCLMKRGAMEALKELFKEYDEDGSALWLYSRALVAFREHGPGAADADAFARSAISANRHVPAVLTGRKRAKPTKNGYLTVGGEDEAAHYVEEWGFDWLTTPGATDWLTRIATAGAPRQKKGSSDR